jgi:hypothetical protein
MIKIRQDHTVVFILGILLLTAVATGAVFVSSASAQDVSTQNSDTGEITQESLFEPNEIRTTPILETQETNIQIAVNDSSNGQATANVTVTIEEAPAPDVPPELEGTVTAAQYNAVLDGSTELTAPNLSRAINGWAASGSVNDVKISAPVLSALINYWANN